MTAEQFKSLRAALGFTQDTLAKAIGVSRGTLIRWERSGHAIPATAVAKIAMLKPAHAPPADPRAGQITKATHGDLYATMGKSIVFLGYHPASLFPELPWPSPVTLDCCPAAVLYTPRYAEAVVAFYKRDLARMAAGGETSVLRPKAYTDEMATAIEAAFNEAVARNKLRVA